MVKELIQGLGGFDGKASSVSAVDLLGLLGTENAKSTVQALIDVIADKVLNQLLLRSNVVNNALTTEEGYALDARMGKSLQDQITAQNSNFLTVEYNSIITISTLKTWTESSYEITSPPVGFSFNDIVSITAFSQKDHWEKWLRLVVNQQAAGRGMLAIIGYGINKTGQIPITIRVCYKK